MALTDASSVYNTLHSSYSSNPFYFKLISYLLCECAKYDRLDLANMFFAKFLHDVDTSQQKHLLKPLTINVWNMLLKIYLEKNIHNEVRNSK